MRTARQALLLIIVIVIVAVVPHLLPKQDEDGEVTKPRSSETYAADGVYVGDRAPEIQPKNIILVLLDTVRRDAVALGDEPARQMPNLRALAKRGVAFRQTSSASSWTIPTVATIFTGLLPSEHNCRTGNPVPKLLPANVTYGEVLRATYGYHTAAFSDVPWYRNETWSLLQGFVAGSAGQGSLLRATRPLDSGFWLHGSREILGAWADDLDRQKPFFLFLHTFDAHDPYGKENHPPHVLELLRNPDEMRAQLAALPDTHAMEPWEILRLMLTSEAGKRKLVDQRGRQAISEGVRYSWEGYRKVPRPALTRELHDRYLEGVRWTDEGLGKLAAFLESSGLMKNTLLVVFSDHGEAFGEHGMIGHGRRLEDELIHVPMVMVGPGPFAKPQVVDASVGLIDIMPTFMDWIGAPDLGRTRGRSLLPLIRGEGAGHPVTFQAEVTPRRAGTEARRLLEGVRDEGWKYIVEYDVLGGSIQEQLYDLQQDPAEQTNLLVDGKVLHDFPLSEAFCAEVEGCRDRTWEIAASIRARELTTYSAGVPTSDQPRPAACGEPAKDR